MTRLAGLIVLASLVACSSFGTVEDYRWSISAPPRVARGTKLVFTVKAAGKDGEAATGLKYHYIVGWPGGESSIRHVGKTFDEEKIRASAHTGPATLLVFAQDQSGNTVKVAETTVMVE